VLHQLSITALLGVWLWRRGLPQTPLLLPIGGVFGGVVISAAFAIDPRMAAENAWHWLIHGLLFLWLIDQVRHGNDERLMRAALLAGGAVAVVGAVEGLLTEGRAGSLFGLINLAGAFVAPMIVLALPRDRTLALLLAFSVMSNQSRGALIAAGVAVFAYVLMERLINRRVLLIAGLLGALVLVGVFNISQQPQRRDGDAIRADLWRAALEMTADDPLTGVGPGLFGSAYRTYRELSEDNATGAHNFYLNTFAELGAPGAIASVILAITFFAYLPAQRTRAQNAALAALIGMGTHMLFDNFPATSYTALAALCAAICIAPVQQPLKLPLRPLARVLAALLVIFAGWLSVLDIAQAQYEISLATGNLASARAALAIDPQLKLYALQVERLAAGDVARLDGTLMKTTDTSAYALVSYGRYWP
jgi:hypothetical protein